jgi:hypothetical protein
MNRVTIHEHQPSTDGTQSTSTQQHKRGKVKEYDLNVADPFWLNNKSRFVKNVLLFIMFVCLIDRFRKLLKRCSRSWNRIGRMRAR